MLRKDQNDLLTQTGPDTPMGNLFRRYWLPVLLSRELPEDGCEPARVEILSEKLIAIRDEEGNTGLIDEFCPHRGASLWFGRYDDKGQGGGIRCPYHGWKFGADGVCLDVPSETEESGYRHRVKLASYPLVERGGIYWTYMGPAEHQPPLPEYEFAMLPPEHSFISKRLQECNWMQALEGGIDSSHVTWLHSGNLNHDPLFVGAKGNEYNKQDLKPVFDVAETPNGLMVAARRNAEEGHYYWRITPWLMPFFTMVPPRGDYPIHGHFWVPINDHTNMAWSFDYHAARPLYEKEVKAMENGHGIHVKYQPGSSFLPLQNKSNNYLIDRQAQKTRHSFSGIEGIGMQDAALQESMGSIADRTKEHLVGTDQGIVKMRRALLAAVKALTDDGTPPPGRLPEDHHVRSAAVVLPKDVPYLEGAAEALKVRSGVPHASV